MLVTPAGGAVAVEALLTLLASDKSEIALLAATVQVILRRCD